MGIHTKRHCLLLALTALSLLSCKTTKQATTSESETASCAHTITTMTYADTIRDTINNRFIFRIDTIHNIVTVEQHLAKVTIKNGTNDTTKHQVSTQTNEQRATQTSNANATHNPHIILQYFITALFLLFLCWFMDRCRRRSP